MDSLSFLLEYEVPFIKIPSAMLTQLELIGEAASSGKPLVVSTGMSELKEIEKAVNLIMTKASKPIIMHTNSSYPTPRAELNLALIPFLKDRLRLRYRIFRPRIRPRTHGDSSFLGRESHRKTHHAISRHVGNRSEIEPRGVGHGHVTEAVPGDWRYVRNTREARHPERGRNPP